MTEEGWGGGLRHLHWITGGGALCSPRLRILSLVEKNLTNSPGYIEDYACKRCKAKLARRPSEDNIVGVQ